MLTGEGARDSSGEESRGQPVCSTRLVSLFQVLRYGFRPSKVAFLAWHAWSNPQRGDWPPDSPIKLLPDTVKEIRHWMQVFAQRFYSFSQFKRSALPNGTEASHGGSLSPRGDWRAPSDMPRQDLSGRDRAGSPRGLSRR